MKNPSLSLTTQILLLLVLLMIGIGSRFLPHPPSATALTAVMFASALYLRPHLTIALTLLLLLWSDMTLGSYELPVMASVYGSFLIIAGFGMWFARTKNIGGRVLMLASSSVLFFLITNAAIWYFTPWYAKDISGLMLSYSLGLPFLKNMLLADFLYTPALIAALALVFSSSPAPKTSLYVS
ncbi:hypothetical protein KJ819_03830 [Patescibacteria group bacterium]|nr:hypothetical protein [Patescibacteria group bacterium]MBU1500489.1 hypothetical protein [Patescibacteria group bacterium]MBU2080713.1 hypothetical protein [Patescibacteria group bacterium]MBU2123818.1 hypothetical protein [Patescibacteria group bacterium]MBU2194891.1 hypothetical protein [Patescibacteria group bacterium]